MQETIEVYSNPRKRRRVRRRSRSRHKRRRNPSELAVLNPRRRRRRSRGGYRRRRRAYGNPGGMGKIPLLNINLSEVMYMGIGVVGTKFAGSFLQKIPFFKEETPGIKGYLVDLAAGFALSQVSGFVFKNPLAKRQIQTGAIMVPLFRLLQEFVLPKLKLSGFGQPEYINAQDFQGLGYYTNAGNDNLLPGSVVSDRNVMFQDQN